MAADSAFTSDRATKTPPEAPADLNEQIVNSLTSGVVVVDAEGVVLTANEAAREHLGLSPSELTVGTPLLGYPPAAAFARLFENVRETGLGMSRQTVQVDVADAESKELGITLSPLDGPDAFNGVIFLFINMTEIRRLERAAEVNRQLASIGELTAGVVHELRNPLTIIRGRAELLLRKLESDESTLKSVQAILGETKTLENLIGQFLGFAKPFQLSKTACRAEQIVERSFALCQRRADNKGVSLAWECQGEIGPLTLDAEKMCQAISNIVNNAIDAVDSTGNVHLTIFQDGAHVRFDVQDNGPGIKIGKNEDLFSPFFSRKRDGTGLGLSIVQKIVTAHGGKVSYTCGETGGTTFKIVVPRE